MKPGDPAAVEQLFDAVAPRYDRLNDVLSFGLHRQWKRQLVRALKPVAGEHWLDLCCGCLLYTSPSPRDKRQSRMPSSA